MSPWKKIFTVNKFVRGDLCWVTPDYRFFSWRTVTFILK